MILEKVRSCPAKCHFITCSTSYTLTQTLSFHLLKPLFSRCFSCCEFFSCVPDMLRTVLFDLQRAAAVHLPTTCLHHLPHVEHQDLKRVDCTVTGILYDVEIGCVDHAWRPEASIKNLKLNPLLSPLLCCRRTKCDTGKSSQQWSFAPILHKNGAQCSQLSD